MPSPFERLQDIPGLRQLAMLVALAVAVAVGVGAYFWAQKPEYLPLYSGLADKDAANVVDALRTAGVDFRIDAASGAISVREPQLHEARMKLASQGLPEQSRLGLEFIQKDQGFGVSQFVENARYQHALENELARTIAQLKPVRDARVHLALPKPSAFARGRDAASASVLVELQPGRTLEGDQVAAVVHLVASSIPDLPPERVSVVDQTGRLLTESDPDSDGAVAAAQFAQQRRLEASYVQRVQELLEPLVGRGRVSAQVAVDMDFTVVEEAKESFTPDPAKVRSEQLAEATGGANAQPQGVPGATSNTPPGSGATPSSALAAGTQAANSTKSATRNFELDRSVSHTRQPPGRVRRVNVAVIVDTVPTPEPGVDGKPGKTVERALGEEQLKQVEALVRQAVGFDEKRGDGVSVVNASFARAAEIGVEDTTPWWRQPAMRDIARLAVGAAIVLLLIFAVLRPTLRALVGPPRRVAADPIVVDAEVVEAPALPPATANGYEDRLRLAKAAVGQDPKKVAQVVKNWVSNDA